MNLNGFDRSRRNPVSNAWVYCSSIVDDFLISNNAMPKGSSSKGKVCAEANIVAEA